MLGKGGSVFTVTEAILGTGVTFLIGREKTKFLCELRRPLVVSWNLRVVGASPTRAYFLS